MADLLVETSVLFSCKQGKLGSCFCTNVDLQVSCLSFETVEVMTVIIVLFWKTQNIHVPSRSSFYKKWLPFALWLLLRCVCIVTHLLEESSQGSWVQSDPSEGIHHWLGDKHTVPFSGTDSSAVILTNKLGIT